MIAIEIESRKLNMRLRIGLSNSAITHVLLS